MLVAAVCPLGNALWAGPAGLAWCAARQQDAPQAQASSSQQTSPHPVPANAVVPGLPQQLATPAQPVVQGALGPPAIVIPRLSREPSLNDFLNMRPEGAVAEQMMRVTGFVQRNPHDGEAVSQRTEAYLGYDQKNLYAVFVCFDEPGKVRGRRARREDIYDDDTVEVMLDTFRDQRRAHAFQMNPLGV